MLFSCFFKTNATYYVSFVLCRFPRPASSYAPSSVGKVGAANNSADDLDAESEEEDLDLEIKV